MIYLPKVCTESPRPSFGKKPRHLKNFHSSLLFREVPLQRQRDYWMRVYSTPLEWQ